MTHVAFGVYLAMLLQNGRYMSLETHRTRSRPSNEEK